MMDNSFSLPRQEFIDAVEKVVMTCEKKTGSKSTLPHFFYVRVDGYGNKLKLSAFNQTRRVAVLIDKVGEHIPFSLGISGGYLDDLKGYLPKGDLLCAVGREFSLYGSDFSFDFAILSGDRFPQEVVVAHKWESANYDDIFSGFGKVSYCAGSSDNSRIYTKAICITKESVVCTDGFRMSMVPNSAIACSRPFMLLPENAHNMITTFDSVAGEGFLDITENEMHMSKGNVYLSTRLLAGDVPNFKSVTPSGPSTQCSIPRERLKLALNRMSVISDKKSIPICLEFGADSLVLRADKDGHRIEDKVTVVYSGGRFSMKVDLKYLLQATCNIKGDRLSVELRGNQMPVMITDIGGKHKNVILPIRDS